MVPFRYHGPGPGIFLFTFYFSWQVYYQGAAIARSSCKVDQCSQQYEIGMQGGRVERGPNLDYCRVLQAYAECIRGTGRKCRGNIQYHTTSTLVEAWTLQYNCSYIVLNAHIFESTMRSHRPRDREQPICDYKHRKHRNRHSHGKDHLRNASTSVNKGYVYCGLFGDPHLRTFSGEYQTCRVKGAWPLLNNKHLAIQVTNEEVIPGSSATATTKLTVIVKRHNVCAQEKTYHASMGSIPGEFVDGSTGSGPEGSVTILSKTLNKHVIIKLRYAGVTLIVRQVHGYLTFAMRMPEALLDKPQRGHLELCTKGCPESERLLYHKLPIAEQSSNSAITMGRVEAEKECHSFNLTGFYFDSCVFDLMATGQTNFAAAAHVARKEMMKLNSGKELNINVIQNDSPVSCSSPVRPSYIVQYLIISFSLLIFHWAR